MAKAEYHTYFCRTEMKQAEKDIPMRPYALTEDEMQTIKTLDTGQSQFGWW